MDPEVVSQSEGHRSHGWRDVARGGSIILIATLVGNVLTLVFQATLARYLSTRDYGAVAFGMTMSLSLALTFSGSVTYLIRRYVALAEGDDAKVRGVLTFGATAAIVMSMFVGGAAFLASGPIAELFLKDRDLAGIVGVFAASIPLGTIALYQRAVYQAFLKVRYTVVHSVVLERFVRVALLFAAIIFVGSAAGRATRFSLIYLVSLGVAVAVGAIAFSPKVWPRERARSIDMRDLSRYLVAVLIIDLVGSLYEYSELFAVGLFLSPQEIGLYNAPLILTGQSTVILTSIGALFMPIISTAYGRNDHEQSAALSVAAMRWIMVLTAPLIVFFVVQSRQVLLVLFGPPFDEAATALIVLAVANLVSNVLGLLIYVLYAYRRSRELFRVTIGALLIKTGAALALVPMFGIEGAALANLLGTVALMGLRARLVGRVISLGFGDRRMWFYLGAAIVVGPIPWLWSLVVPTETLWSLTVGGLLYVGAFGAVLLRTGLLTIAQARALMSDVLRRRPA